MIYYQETKYGFNYGSCEITRQFSDNNKKWVTLSLKTPKEDIQIYITKTGKIRIHSKNGNEWINPKIKD